MRLRPAIHQANSDNTGREPQRSLERVVPRDQPDDGSSVGRGALCGHRQSAGSCSEQQKKAEQSSHLATAEFTRIEAIQHQTLNRYKTLSFGDGIAPHRTIFQSFPGAAMAAT